ncbi:armadillo-type protein [Lipomyces orientalis]|uniref:Armadillo-type protein n=1 Tax=Lipomyces orientalis TaxID=1233043 RepID=A0ACC3TI59_9ASCO
MQAMASPAPRSPKHLVSNILPMSPSNFIHRFVPMSPKGPPMRMSHRKPTWKKLYNDDDDVFGGVPVKNGTVVHSPKFLDSVGIDNEFELLLDSRGISEHMRPLLRELDLNLKSCLINNDMCPSPTVIISPTNVRESKAGIHSRTHLWSPKRLRRTATMECSPTKNIVLSSPDSFVEYLFDINLSDISVIAAIELKRALRCERLQWMERFLNLNGIDPISRLLIGLTKLEWREDKDDRLFLELMHCLRTISEFEMGRDHITTIAPLLFPKLIDFMFSDSQPTYFADRGLIVSVIVNYIAIARPEDRYHRCKAILSCLEDPMQPAEKLAPSFIEVSHRRRAYRNWCLECSNVVRDVFWIFIHTSYHIRLISITPEDVFARQDSTLKKRRSASGHISDVEWDTIEYLAVHIELLNLILASVPTQSERNGIRKQMKDSGFDSLIGKYLRASSGNQSKSLHNNLETLIALAFTDGWNTEYMRTGMRRDGELAQADNTSIDVPTLPMKTLLSQDLFSLPEVDILLSGPESRTFEPASDPLI